MSFVSCVPLRVLNHLPCLTALGDYFRLSANSKVQPLRLRLVDLMPEFMPWVPWVLTDIAAPEGPQLRNLEFEVWLWGASQLRNKYWDEIASILSNPRYACLESVAFVQHGHANAHGSLQLQGTRDMLQKRFPLLHESEILHVVDGAECLGAYP